MAKREPLKFPEGFHDDRLPKGTFSYSQYSAYKKCAAAYELKYVKGLPSPGNVRMARGVAIHSLVEQALRKKMRGEVVKHEELFSETTDVVKDAFGDIADWEGTDEKAATQAVRDAYSTYHVYALPKLNPVAVEQPFAVKVADVPMVGYIDVVDLVPIADGVADETGEVPSRQVVVDLKTTEKTWSQDQVDRSPQLSLYAAATGIPDVRIDMLVQLKKGTEYRSVNGTRSHTAVEVFKEDLAETADLIKKGIFPKAAIDSWGCAKDWCSYWSICRGRNR